MENQIHTVKTLCNKYPKILCEGGIRHFIFHSEKNGLAASGAILKMGRKVLIDEEKFFDWMRNGQAN